METFEIWIERIFDCTVMTENDQVQDYSLAMDQVLSSRSNTSTDASQLSPSHPHLSKLKSRDNFCRSFCVYVAYNSEPNFGLTRQNFAVTLPNFTSHSIFRQNLVKCSTLFKFCKICTWIEKGSHCDCFQMHMWKHPNTKFDAGHKKSLFDGQRQIFSNIRCYRLVTKVFYFQ